jgi:hypothetical protein
MTRPVHLSRHHQVIIGSDGAVALTGDGVMPRHAAITAVKEGSGEVHALLRAIQGPVFVERRGRRQAVASPRRLADGDVIIVGPHRLTYRDLGSPRDAGDQWHEEVVQWLL